MKSIIYIISLSVTLVNQIYSQKVGLNTTSPIAPFHIVQPANFPMYNLDPVIFSEYTGATLVDIIAIKGKSKPADGWGIGGDFEGGSIGVNGYVSGTSGSSFTGVKGEVTGDGYGAYYALFGEASGQGTNIGVYGKAISGNVNWAGYFDGGNVFINNNLGIGNTSPTMDVDILDFQSVIRLTSNSSSNGSVLELRNSTTSPNILGAINFGTAISTSGQIAYLNDDHLTIRVNNAERVHINPSGLFGIGRTPATNRLEVEGNASKSSAGDWLANSDARLKKNIEPLDAEEMIEKLLSLKGVTYEWNDDKTGNVRPEGVQYGFTAQNIQEVFPTLVEEDTKGYLQTAYGTYDAMTVEAIRYLYMENQSLKSELEEVKILLKQVLASR